MNKYFFSSLRLFHCGKYLVFCNRLNEHVKLKKEVNKRKLIWYIPSKYFEAYFFMMYFSSLTLKQRNQNTAVGTHGDPEHAQPTSWKGEGARPLARMHSNMAAASLPGCHGDIPITTMLSILQTCLRQVKVFPMMVPTPAQHPVASHKS